VLKPFLDCLDYTGFLYDTRLKLKIKKKIPVQAKCCLSCDAGPLRITITGPELDMGLVHLRGWVGSGRDFFYFMGRLESGQVVWVRMFASFESIYSDDIGIIFCINYKFADELCNF